MALILENDEQIVNKLLNLLNNWKEYRKTYDFPNAGRLADDKTELVWDNKTLLIKEKGGYNE